MWIISVEKITPVIKQIWNWWSTYFWLWPWLCSCFIVLALTFLYFWSSSMLQFLPLISLNYLAKLSEVKKKNRWNKYETILLTFLIWIRDTYDEFLGHLNKSLSNYFILLSAFNILPVFFIFQFFLWKFYAS